MSSPCASAGRSKTPAAGETIAPGYRGACCCSKIVAGRLGPHKIPAAHSSVKKRHPAHPQTRWMAVLILKRRTLGVNAKLGEGRAFSFFRHSRPLSFLVIPALRHSRPPSFIPVFRYSCLLSFPRKRESTAPCHMTNSRLQGCMDSRSPIGVGDKLRGNDGFRRNDGNYASQPRK